MALGLIDAGCDVNMVPSGGKFEGVSVLRVAKKRRRMATVDMLENAGATDVSVSKKPKGKKKGSKGKKGKKSDDDSRRNYTPRGGVLRFIVVCARMLSLWLVTRVGMLGLERFELFPVVPWWVFFFFLTTLVTPSIPPSPCGARRYCCL